MQIASDRDFAKPVVDDRIPALIGYFVPPRELPPDHYHWRVRYRVAEAAGASRTLPPVRLVGIGAGYGRNGARENFFKGLLDDVRVYHTALPPGDVPAAL